MKRPLPRRSRSGACTFFLSPRVEFFPCVSLFEAHQPRGAAHDVARSRWATHKERALELLSSRAGSPNRRVVYPAPSSGIRRMLEVSSQRIAGGCKDAARGAHGRLPPRLVWAPISTEVILSVDQGGRCQRPRGGVAQTWAGAGLTRLRFGLLHRCRRIGKDADEGSGQSARRASGPREPGPCLRCF